VRVVFVLFDSLNRRALGCYGSRSVPTPNFDRLAARCVTFDNHYVGSLPCMPARRDMHTGRLNFLHRAWGPLEPFDNAFPELLSNRGTYTHLISDHFHYWGDGGATYHNRFVTYDFVRGQDSDPWRAMVAPPWAKLRERYHPTQYSDGFRTKYRNNIVNREFVRDEADFPSWQCFEKAFEFLDLNGGADDWLLQLETFDPHEPFHTPKRFRERFPTGYTGPTLDWPPYARVGETAEEIEELRANYAATLTMCDELIGRLLDRMDRDRMWEDTALVVTTDHGFLLGEHDWWAKNVMPCYNEVAHIPLFVHHPAAAAHAGERRRSLTQTIDLMPTFMDCFGAKVPPEVMGHSLLPMLHEDRPVRETAIYGVFGSAVNVTDGRHTYLRYPTDLKRPDLFQYTVMPTFMNTLFSVEELREAGFADPFAFTKGVPLLKVPATPKSTYFDRYGPGRQFDARTVLFDLESDPDQLRPVEAPEVEARLTAALRAHLSANDAPAELFGRLGLAAP
jgi:arylsulfatase A-like enzyme